MSATILTGPSVSSGPCIGLPNASPEYSSLFGPGIDYQGDALPDVRYQINKDHPTVGSLRAHLNHPYVVSADAIPSTLQPANIAAAQAATTGVALTLAAAASPGISTNVPVVSGSGAIVVAPITLDYGFDTASVVAGSLLLTPTDVTRYVVGMPLVIPNVGNAAGTSALMTIVRAISASGIITLGSAPLVTSAAAMVGAGNAWSVVPSAVTGHLPYMAAGLALLFDPAQALTRSWRVVSNNAGDTTWSVTVTGMDVYGRTQTETRAVTANGTTWGKKTFKHILSVVANSTGAAATTGTLSIGTSDVFGLALRNDKWEYDNFYWAGAFLAASTGWTPADRTSPATSTTGDVRGTIQIGTNGPLGSGAVGGASNGTSRLALFSSLPINNLTQATPANPAPMYGVVPA